jgi:hypothetical protein
MNSERSQFKQQEGEKGKSQSFGQQVHEMKEGREFSSVEDLLRHDSEVNPVPPEIGERLNLSIAAEPKPERPWYKRLLGS